MPEETALPPWRPGLRVGLFGGSFNPPHAGHRLVALQCLDRLALDRVWVLVSPGNPLKDHTELAPLAERLAATEALMDDSRLAVTGFEQQRGFAYTAQTVAYLRAACPGVAFVWIMGADSLVTFDRWENWRAIAAALPMAVYDRPGVGADALQAPAARALAGARLPEDAAPTLADTEPPAWIYLHGVVSDLSSTDLRKARKPAL